MNIINGNMIKKIQKVWMGSFDIAKIKTYHIIFVSTQDDSKYNFR